MVRRKTGEESHTVRTRKTSGELARPMNEDWLQALLQLNELAGAPLREISDFAMEAAGRLTQSKISFLVLISPDEKVAEMHSWSKATLHNCKDASRLIEHFIDKTSLLAHAVQERKPVIINDYPAQHAPIKDCPAGHMPVLRYMNVPVIEDDRLVLMCGVANKDADYSEADAHQLMLLMHGMWQLIQRKKHADLLRLNEARLQALVDLQQMKSCSLNAITDFALEAAVNLTQSKIGYLAFLSNDEKVLIMHSWSKAAMEECSIINKPIVYQVAETGLWGEAVRQRKAIVTNDYMADNPMKKGFPEGHVGILRHMNVPILDQDGRAEDADGAETDQAQSSPAERQDRIVVLAGVGNKEEPYDETDVRQLTLLMQGMWQLIQHKRQQEKLREAHDELELRVKERTAELEEARLAAEAASLAKSTFLATMSHEIRTPLNAVIGMTELVLKSQLSTRQREFLMTVKDSGEALLSVINDILDFSKIEAGKMVLEHRVFDLKESLGDTLKSFAIPAHEKKLELTCAIEPNVPRMVMGDYNRLRQIVVNLVGNAVKFTDQGEVGLDVWLEPSAENDVCLHFCVHDSGPGIPEEKRNNIFKMFEQVDSTTTRRHGGTGLGLAIASRLVELMNGRIWLEPGDRGSRFHFIIRLDLSGDDKTNSIASEPASLHDMRVLVVDDNATNRRVLEAILSNWHMLPDTASSTEEALAAIKKAQQEGSIYKLIITDALMPALDGFSLAQEIKKDPEISSSIIMMLTSSDHPEDILRCKQLGIASYLMKPVKQSELLEAIQLALGIVVPAPVIRCIYDAQPPVTNLRILISEDSLVNQQLVVALLEGQGHKVTIANNGREAVEAFDRDEFDLVLMDVQMPVMDGFEATAIIKSRLKQNGTHVPVVAMTAYALKGDEERCLQAGMDHYISKPIRAQELFDIIDLIFANRKLNTENGPQAGSAVDWVKVLQVAGGNLSVAREMMKTASEELSELMSAVRQNLNGGDFEGLRYAAHAIRGSSWYLGTTNVAELTGNLEEFAVAQDKPAASAGAASLATEIDRVLEAMHSYQQDG